VNDTALFLLALAASVAVAAITFALIARPARNGRRT
jgi:peptidoglycan/LPS O-acetylase OafA/YrhL